MSWQRKRFLHKFVVVGNVMYNDTRTDLITVILAWLA